MLEALRKRRRNREVLDRLYAAIVERARNPDFFIAGGLPDTVMGRFESLGLQVFLVLDRCRENPALGALAQDLVDRFMLDIDHSMRELGIGYQAVPKRMRKLAGRFYARVGALKGLLAARDEAALASELRFSVLGEEGEAGSERFLARSLVREADQLAAWPEARILEGMLPPVKSEEGTDAVS